MSLPLKDIGKAKITAETDAWLTYRARHTGRTKHELLRDALHEMAVREIHAAKLLIALADGEGLAGERRSRGGEEQGAAGKAAPRSRTR